MRVVAFGTYDVRSHPRVGVLIEGLRAHGHDVVEVNEPLGLDTAARVAMLRQPWRLPLLGLRLARCWRRLWRRGRALLRSDGVPDVVLVGYLGHFDVHLARRRFPASTVVLDQLVSGADTARDRGESGGVKQRLLRALDDAALGAADVVVVDTDEHLATLPDHARHKGVVALVGAPTAWWQPPRDDSAEGPLRVVFFGLFTPLQGCVVIGEALALLAADGAPVHTTMVGHGQDLAAAQQAAGRAPDVDWRQWVPAEDLPPLVAGHDVCLGIFGTGPKARRVVPNKVFQGAAAGCAIVTSDTPPQQRVLGADAVLVPPGDAAALAAALRRLASDRAELAGRRAAARDLADRAFTPAAVVAPLLERLSRA